MFAVATDTWDCVEIPIGNNSVLVFFFFSYLISAIWFAMLQISPQICYLEHTPRVEVEKAVPCKSLDSGFM